MNKNVFNEVYKNTRKFLKCYAATKLSVLMVVEITLHGNE